jgi:hypothetical protein
MGAELGLRGALALLSGLGVGVLALRGVLRRSLLSAMCFSCLLLATPA